MDFLSTIIAAVLAGVSYILGIYLFLLFANMILSFVRADPGNGVVRFVNAICEPPCRALRSRFPGLIISSGGGAVDLSPMIVMLGIGVVRIFLDYLHDYFRMGGGIF